jgi:hypothetical protein
MLGLDAMTDAMSDAKPAALNALELVAKVGWLSKDAWNVSKNVHAFAKPIKVTLTAAVSDAVKTGVLSRSTIVQLQLEDNITPPSPMPPALRQLDLSDTFSEYDKVELPPSLSRLNVTVGLNHDATALRSLVQRLPSELVGMTLCRVLEQIDETSPERDLLEGMECSQLSNLKSLDLRSVGGSMALPSQLLELSIDQCCFNSDLNTMGSLQQLHLTMCHFKADSRLVLQEGLVSLECYMCNSLALPSVLPSTLQHLELTSNYNVPLGVLPHGLKTLILGNRFNCPLGTLPQSLQLLEVGVLFNQDLRPLPPQLKHLNLGKQ